jgi:hypothetical protein
MDEEDLDIIIKEFYSFKKKLSEDINSSSIKSGDCYLIEEYWIDEFENSINNYNNYKNKKDKDYSEFIPDYITNINFFSTIINCLQNNKNFELVSKKLLELSYDEDGLKSDICTKYYSGKNKLLLGLKDDKDNKNKYSILLIDHPLNKNEIQNRTFIISSQKGKKDISFYKSLIEKDNFNYKSEEIENDIIIFPFKKYSNILKLYDNALENIYNNYIDKNNQNIYLNLDDFTECDFEKMNPEQKYAVLVQMINNIFPIVNKNSIESELLNEKIPKIKTKYYLGNNNSRSSNNFGYSNISVGDNSTYGSSTLDNFGKNSLKALKKIKMEPLSELSYRRAKILLQDNQIRLKTFSIFD